jgi:hypothetical protein
MTIEAEQLLAAALKKVDLRGGFQPAELGAKIGLTKLQADAAARVLANAGVLVLGFDRSAEFSPDFRKTRIPAATSARGAKKKRSGKALAAAR